MERGDGLVASAGLLILYGLVFVGFLAWADSFWRSALAS